MRHKRRPQARNLDLTNLRHRREHTDIDPGEQRPSIEGSARRDRAACDPTRRMHTHINDAQAIVFFGWTSVDGPAQMSLVFTVAI